VGNRSFRLVENNETESLRADTYRSRLGHNQRRTLGSNAGLSKNANATALSPAEASATEKSAPRRCFYRCRNKGSRSLETSGLIFQGQALVDLVSNGLESAKALEQAVPVSDSVN
jgi:hypothetical protein